MSMQVIAEPGARPIKAWIDKKPDGTLNIEDSALQQAKNLARLPFIAKNGVALMPDVHAGVGSTVGSVIATVGAVIPATVGVDIGCGMNAVRLSLRADQLPDSLANIRSLIEQRIPNGFGQHQKSYVPAGHDSSDQFPDGIHPLWAQYHATTVKDRLKRGAGDDKVFEKAWFQLGTLGGGNHFIELCIDEQEQVWVMLHSGSRGVGNMIGSHYIAQAKELMEKMLIKLPDNNLAFLPEGHDLFREYMDSVSWGQAYALENRRQMMGRVLAVLHEAIPTPFTLTTEAVNCHHNYVEKERHFGQDIWVTRKGAVRAGEGDLGIIPGSMGQRSYIVRGKGNAQSYCSCSHGAGRVMSRTEARKRFSLVDLVAQTQGVECRKDDAVLDEIPASYKPIDQVMANQSDLVEVVHELRAVLCVKGG
jgi:tRNA-splicing ligase RtcB